MGLSVQEAGRRGGLAILNERGRDHFVAIGKKGHQTLQERYPGMASDWGKKGGQA